MICGVQDPCRVCTFKELQMIPECQSTGFRLIKRCQLKEQDRIVEDKYLNELFVQYLKDGEIKFNPLTKNILVGYGPYGSKSIASTQNLADAQEHLNMIANTIPYYVEDVLRANAGDIFVM